MNGSLLRPAGPGPRAPEDGFVRALREARRRRWRTLCRAAAGGSATVALLAVAAAPPAGSLAGLEPASPGALRTHRRTPSASPGTPAPPRATAVVTGLPGERPGGTAVAGGTVAGPGPERPAGTAPAAPAPPVPASQPRPGAQDPAADPPRTNVPAEPPPEPPGPPPAEPSPTRHREPPAPEPVLVSYEDQPVDAPCEGSAGWCLAATVTGGGATRSLRLRACRPTSDTQGVVRFAREVEADFRVLRQGRVVWQWSVGQSDVADPHEVTVDRWQCAVWSTPWSGSDQAGGAVAPGRYELAAQSRATNLPTAWRSVTFDYG